MDKNIVWPKQAGFKGLVPDTKWSKTGYQFQLLI